MDTSHSVEATVTSIASKGMSGGAATSMFGWMTSNEAIALIGVTITILGFVINIVFQIRRDRREQELQRAKLKAIK
jgi:hypothetical protein